MSLIEQAARRLEQLREAGSQVAGQLSIPSADEEALLKQEAEASMIEKATQRMRELHDAREAATPPAARAAAAPALPTAPEPPQAEPPVPQTPSPSVSRARPQPAPRAADVMTPAPRELRAASGRRSREVEIDFDRIMERGLLTPNAAQSRLANELRVIKRPLINNCLGKGATPVKNARRIMVTSALPGEGKSFISMNLALSIAMEKDSTVLLLEGDPTRPALAEMLGIPPARGLMDLLVDPRLDVADVMIRTNLGRLSFIPAGTRQENATELLASTVMEELVEQLYERYPDRILIFDSPPLLAAPEPRVLAQHMGQIVYVVEAEQTSQSTVQEAISTVEACPVVMAVLNKSAFREEGYYYSYYYAQPE